MNTEKNIRKTKGSLWKYCRDQPSNPLSIDSESFKCKTSITGNNYNVGTSENNFDANKISKNETENVIPRKHISNFWRTLYITLINCEIELIFTWSKNCVLADMTRRNAQRNNHAILSPRGLEFQIKDTKLYAPVVTLSTENGKKLLEQLKSGFKGTIKWNTYRSQMTTYII